MDCYISNANLLQIPNFSLRPHQRQEIRTPFSSSNDQTNMSLSLSNILGSSSGGFIAHIASKEASTIIQLVRGLFAVAPAVVYMHLKGPSTPPPYLYPPPFIDFPTPTTPALTKPTVTMEIQGPPTTVLPAILVSFIVMIITLAARSYTSPLGPAPRRKVMGRSQAPLPDPAFDFKSIGSPRRIPKRARAPSPSPPPSPPPPPPDPPAMSAPPIKPPPTRGFPWLFLLFAVVTAAIGYIVGTYREPLKFGLWIDRMFAFFGHGDARGRFVAFLASNANWLFSVFRSPPWPVDTSLSLLRPSSLSLYMPALTAATCSITSSPLPLPPLWNPLSLPSEALVFGQTMPFYDWVASVNPFGVCSGSVNVVMIPVPASASYWNLFGSFFLWAAIALRCCIESFNVLRAYLYGLPVLLVSVSHLWFLYNSHSSMYHF